METLKNLNSQLKTLAADEERIKKQIEEVEQLKAEEEKTSQPLGTIEEETEEHKAAVYKKQSSKLFQ